MTSDKGYPELGIISGFWVGGQRVVHLVGLKGRLPVEKVTDLHAR